MTDDRLRIWISFAKFILGSVCIGGVTLAINSAIQKREVTLKEQEHLSKFMDTALGQDVGPRTLMAKYFASVTQSDALRDGWKNYLAVLESEARDKSEQIATKRRRLLDLESAIDLNEQGARSPNKLSEVQLLREQLGQLQSELDPRGRLIPSVALDLVTKMTARQRLRLAHCGKGIQVVITTDENSIVNGWQVRALSLTEQSAPNSPNAEAQKLFGDCLKSTMDETDKAATQNFIKRLPDDLLLGTPRK